MKRQMHEKYSLMFLIVGFILLVQLLVVLFGGVIVLLIVKFGAISLEDTDRMDALSVIMFAVGTNNMVVLIVSLFGSHIPLKPINRLISQVNKLASGNFKARLDLGHAFSVIPAFAELSDSFNKLAEELDNTEILRADFVNNFSHEFKTPLVSIAGFAKLLRRGNLSEREKLEYLAVIEEESLRLSNLATHVLDLTRVENQVILTGVSEFNLSEQIRSCILMLENKWIKKNITFYPDFAEYIISANEGLLKQVWSNLLDNAVKFSPNGGTIAVDIREDGEAISVSVTNPGEEIPPEQHKRIFQKFYQADRSHLSEGNGIGLAIVKRIVELHRGKVSVHSDNGISVFTVDLPKNQ